MTGPANAREALLAEALGDMVAVLDRVEAVGPALQDACGAVTAASEALTAQVAAVATRVNAVTELATLQAIKHIARRTDELARGAAQTETRAMQEAARSMLRAELTPAIQRLVQAIDRHGSSGGRWQATWWAHAITALSASAVTCLLWRM